MAARAQRTVLVEVLEAAPTAAEAAAAVAALAAPRQEPEVAQRLAVARDRGAQVALIPDPPDRPPAVPEEMVAPQSGA